MPSTLPGGTGTSPTSVESMPFAQIPLLDGNGPRFASVEIGRGAGGLRRKEPHVSYSILVADDDPSVRKFLQTALELKGHVVDCCQDGQAALRKLDGASYDLLITDFNMPRATGVEVLEDLRSRHNDIPVILMSSYDIESLSALVRSFANLELLQKPFGLPELFATLRRAFDPRGG